MFFPSDNFSVKILTVLDINRGPHSGQARLRPFHALSFRIVGDSDFTYGNRTLKAGSGDLTFLPAYVDYYINAADEQLFVVHFQTDVEMPSDICSIHVVDFSGFLRDFQRLYCAWVKKGVGYEHECRYLFYKIIYNIEKEYESFTDNRQDPIADAAEYIHENLYDPDFSVSTLAEHYSMSDTYFRRLFKQRYRTTPVKYICNLKTQRAIELLKSSYYTVSEVAEKCGFENVYYFSSFMKKQTGFSPSAIRDSIENEKF